MRVAVVDDGQLSYDRIEKAYKERGQEGRHFVFEKSLSIRIRSEDEFDTVKKTFQNFEGDLIAILDMGLDLHPTFKQELRKVYNVPGAVGDNIIDGCVIAIEALRNTKIRPLLIVIATNLGGQANVRGFLNTYLDTYRNDGSAKIITSYDAFPLGDEAQDYTREILDHAFREFARMSGDPIAQLFYQTKSWFDSEKKDSELEPPYLRHPFKDHDLALHRQVVQRVWPWFPDRWWASPQSAENLHNNLKCLCGSHSRWMSKNGINSLSVGAAYLLLLMAMERANHGSSARALIPSFEGLDKATNPLIPNQEMTTAVKTVTALYNVFDAIVTDDRTNESAIESVVFDPPGSQLQVNLSWEADRGLAKAGNILVDVLEKNQCLPEYGKTLRRLIDFIILSQVNMHGFGSPGRIRVENKLLQMGAS